MTFCSWAKTALWSATISKVTGTRGTVGVGVALAVGIGTGVRPGPRAPTTGVAIATSSGSSVRGVLGRLGLEDRGRCDAIWDGTSQEPVDLGHRPVVQVVGTRSIRRDGTDAARRDHQAEGGDEEQATVEAGLGRAGHAERLTCGW